MLLGFEDAFMEIQSGYITLCLDLAGNVDEVNVFIYQDDVSCTFNAFFVKDGKIKTPDESAAESIVDKFYELGVEDIDKLIGVCEKFDHKCPNEFRLTYNTHTKHFDAKYGYSNYAETSELTPFDVFVDWMNSYSQSETELST